MTAAALGTPDPLRTGRAATDRAARHLLGSENDAVRRMANAMDRTLGPAPSGRVPLRTLGQALAAPTGAAYDDGDPADRALLARVLTVLALRFEVAGWELRDVLPEPAPGALLTADRRPRRGVMQPPGWLHVASRAELARWVVRAAAGDDTDADDPDDPDDPGDPDDDDPDLDLAGQLDGTGDPNALAAARALIRAAGGPPPVTFGGGVPVPAPSREAFVSGGLTATACARSGGFPDVPCVAVYRAVYRCPTCGAPTPVPERVIGPRLLDCACLGGVICAHPVCGPPPARGAAPRNRPAQGRAS